ncbi:hypothetical protein IG631_00095 [Alternaria alternata]|nr:hypothetical protein IG631_00095 [Alternaria alternata]
MDSSDKEYEMRTKQLAGENFAPHLVHLPRNHHRSLRTAGPFINPERPMLRRRRASKRGLVYRALTGLEERLKVAGRQCGMQLELWWGL